MTRREFPKGICRIEGCDRITVGRGWCRKHYNRWFKTGDPLVCVSTPKGEHLRWIKQHLHYLDGETCLIWPFGRTKRGYAQTRYNGHNANASRVVCLLAHGEPPHPDMEAAHSCGRGHAGCVNPRHLRWATKVENAADRVLHGTNGKGEQNPAAKLTEADVLSIRELAKTTTQKEIAAQYGIYRQHVSAIVSRSRWGWL